MTRLLNWSSIIYSRLLWVCPKDLRRDFGPEMKLLFDDILAESWAEAGIPGIVRVWFGALGELIQIAFVNAAGAPGAIVPAISCALSAICFGGQLMLIRSTPGTGDALWPVVIWPSLTAGAVSLLATRICARNTILSLCSKYKV
jgi:hypothetical protein